MHCNDARPLVPAYVDGELSEAQAGLLRKHLLGCQPCRGRAQEDKALKRWFEPQAAAAVPPGFAARVARRAFAGDTGEGRPAEPAAEARGGKLLPFVLRLTAVAAALLLMLSIAVRMQGLPSGSNLRADDRAPVPVEEILQELDRLNTREAAAGETPEEPTPVPESSERPGR
jgi:anti-sigma factor RsiW